MIENKLTPNDKVKANGDRSNGEDYTREFTVDHVVTDEMGNYKVYFKNTKLHFCSLSDAIYSNKFRRSAINVYLEVS